MRRTTTAAVVVGLLAGCGWPGSASDEEKRPGSTAAEADRALQQAAHQIRAQVTGAFSVEPVGVSGSFDIAHGSQKVDYSGSEVVDGKNRDYVLRRIGVGDEVYFELDRGKGDKCWFDATGSTTFDTPQERDVDVIRLVEGLRARSGGGHVFEATVPVGLLRNALFGRPTGSGGMSPAADLTRAPSADEPSSTRVPVQVRTGKKAIAQVRVDPGDVLDALEEAGVSPSEGFGRDIQERYLRDVGDITVSYTAYGFPVTIDRPDPQDIGLGLKRRC